MESALDTKPVFRARHIAKVYRTGEGEIHALSDVGLDIHRGEFAVRLGPSGSDKSQSRHRLKPSELPRRP